MQRDEDRSDRLDKDGPVTLSHQVADDIRADIGDGKLAAGERLPPLADLCEIYGVSAPTIRSAVEELARDGKVSVVRGKGTFVAGSDTNPT